MKSTSLVAAKAHLSKLVDDAEHRGKRILIMRHGKPAAAIVPVEVAQPRKAKPALLDEAGMRALLARMGSAGTDGEVSAVDDLRAGRARGEPAPEAGAIMGSILASASREAGRE